MAVDLHTVIGYECIDDINYCGQVYWAWEKDVAQPILEEKGYHHISWFDIERDSFGPLIRGVNAYKDEVKHEFYYG
jgi:hypothetical protein